MSPHNTVTYVASFPPAALPAFSGTMMPSDSLCLICLPSFVISCPAYSQTARKQRASRVAAHSLCQTCHGLRPRGGDPRLAIVATNHIDFRRYKYVVPPIMVAFGAQSLQPLAYGLPARCPTLNLRGYPLRSKDSLPGGRPTFRDGIPTRLNVRPCPAALYLKPSTCF